MTTGPERHSRKFTAITEDNQVEYYGVLIANAGDGWRARIFTYPDTLWKIPGGARTIKFAGATARDAEQRAIHYIEEYCAEQGSKLSETEDDEVPPRVDIANADHKGARADQQHRHRCKLPIRFGEKIATQAATTANLSANGVYIATRNTVAKGTRIHLALSVDAYTIAMIGTVMWVRDKEEPGKPMGIGVRLERPPAMYLRYVDEVREKVTGN